jgi:hypothetical protein
MLYVYVIVIHSPPSTAFVSNDIDANVDVLQPPLPTTSTKLTLYFCAGGGGGGGGGGAGGEDDNGDAG